MLELILGYYFSLLLRKLKLYFSKWLVQCQRVHQLFFGHIPVCLWWPHDSLVRS